VTHSKQLDELLARLPEGDIDVQRFMQAIYDVRFTGSYTVECFNGKVRQINLGAPLRLTIAQGEDPIAAGGGLDKRHNRRSG
jgi:sugar phosphate isomerase/epimerase